MKKIAVLRLLFKMHKIPKINFRRIMGIIDDYSFWLSLWSATELEGLCMITMEKENFHILLDNSAELINEYHHINKQGVTFRF